MFLVKTTKIKNGDSMKFHTHADLVLNDVERVSAEAIAFVLCGFFYFARVCACELSE